MRPPHRILDRKRVYRLAEQHLQAHLQFKGYKRQTSAQVLWTLLLAAAARITSLSDACGRLRDAPSDETARKALLATLPDYAALQRQLNAALAGHLPKALRTHPQRLAIDLTLIPYHGRPFRDLDEVYRGQAKDGTSHFHAYATAYVVRHGRRSTVALTGVRKGEPLKDVIPPTPAAAGRQRRRPVAAAVARSRLLQRGGGALPPTGAVPVPDAGGLSRPLSQAPERPHRQLCLPDLEDERLVPLHPGRRQEADSDGVDLREVPQFPRGAEAARASGVDLRLLGLPTILAGCGVHDVPAAVRDRVELAPAARGADSDDDPPPGGTAAVRGDRAGASEPLGVAALCDPLEAAARRSGHPAGATAVGDAAALVAPCGRGGVRGRRHHLYRKRCAT